MNCINISEFTCSHVHCSLSYFALSYVCYFNVFSNVLVECNLSSISCRTFLFAKNFKHTIFCCLERSGIVSHESLIYPLLRWSKGRFNQSKMYCSILLDEKSYLGAINLIWNLISSGAFLIRFYFSVKFRLLKFGISISKLLAASVLSDV